MDRLRKGEEAIYQVKDPSGRQQDKELFQLR
jgi:hypothetical protein